MDIKPYSGYRTPTMRFGRSSTSGRDAQSGAKRTRLSKAKADRVLYCSAKGYKQNPRRYQELCEHADKLNGIRRVVHAEVQ
jgi:hypothetical protein